MTSRPSTTSIPLRFVSATPRPAWVTGSVDTAGGPVWKAATTWTREDHWGQVRSRISAYRMSYRVSPGLYAIGNPGPDSPVFASANYKLSFDILRRSLSGLDGWILVLDTKGINVWCAAGKGTFGTGEMVQRIRSAQLDRVVTHRKIIAPQLGAPGVDAAQVAKDTGFRVYFGPVHARDIKAYLDAGWKAAPEMRRTRFSLLDRLVLTPMEINPSMKKYPWFAAAVLVLMGLQPSGILFQSAWQGGWPLLLLGFITVLCGALFTPLLLPFIPGRAFALKGWITGMLATLASLKLLGVPGQVSTGLYAAACFIFFPLASSYIALQFTGSTTFTSMSGTKKELKLYLPIYLAGAAATVVVLVIMKIKEWDLI